MPPVALTKFQKYICIISVNGKWFSIQRYLRNCFPYNLNCEEDEQLSTYLLLSVVLMPLFRAKIFELGC